MLPTSKQNLRNLFEKDCNSQRKYFNIYNGRKNIFEYFYNARVVTLESLKAQGYGSKLYDGPHDYGRIPATLLCTVCCLKILYGFCTPTLFII